MKKFRKVFGVALITVFIVAISLVRPKPTNSPSWTVRQ